MLRFLNSQVVVGRSALISLKGLLCGLLLSASTSAGAQRSSAVPQRTDRTVAITFDDLPYVNASERGGANMRGAAVAANRAILKSLWRYQVPATGFVVEQRVHALGKTGPALLAPWNKAELELGNHSFSHADSNGLDLEGFRNEVIKGEETIRLMAQSARRSLRFFRFPFNHMGDTPEKRIAFEALLIERGYQLAASTIDTSDYIFDQAREQAIIRSDITMRKRIEDAYIAYSRQQIVYYANLNRAVLGYEPPAIMLLHLNQLNAATLPRLLRIFRQENYRFVSLGKAHADPAYARAPRVATKFGPMWGYRWANERQIKVDGTRESEPPEWVVRYAQER